MAFDLIHELLPTPPNTQPSWVAWQGLSPWLKTAIRAPLFMLGDCPSGLSAYYHDHVGETDTGVYRLRDTGVTGSGMIVRDNMLIASNHLGHSVAYCQGQLSSGRIRAESTYAHRSAGQAVLLLGGGYDVYGHWLVDIMPKLYALALAGLDCASLTYFIPADVQAFGYNWLEAVGIRPEQLMIYEPGGEIVTAHDLVVPVLLRSGSRASILFPGAVQDLLDALSQHAIEPLDTLTLPTNIFVSRARANRDGRAMRGRAEIEAIALGEGYAVLHPEQLSLRQQVALFRNARQVVGEYGSALHASIFSKKDVVLCALRGAARHPGFLQSGLAQALGRECGYVLGDAPIAATQFNFTIDAADLRRALLLMSLPRA